MAPVQREVFDQQGFLSSLTRWCSRMSRDTDVEGGESHCISVCNTDTPPELNARNWLLSWPNNISQEMVAAPFKPDRMMSTIDLFQYIQHCDAQRSAL
jgi:hypothetical protein